MIESHIRHRNGICFSMAFSMAFSMDLGCYTKWHLTDRTVRKTSNECSRRAPIAKMVTESSKIPDLAKGDTEYSVTLYAMTSHIISDLGAIRIHMTCYHRTGSKASLAT